MNISQAMQICHQHNTKVYGTSQDGILKVEITENGGRTIRSKHHHTKQKELNKAVAETYFYFAKRLQAI